MMNARESRHSGERANVYALLKGYPLICFNRNFRWNSGWQQRWWPFLMKPLTATPFPTTFLSPCKACRMQSIMKEFWIFKTSKESQNHCGERNTPLFVTWEMYEFAFTFCIQKLISLSWKRVIYLVWNQKILSLKKEISIISCICRMVIALSSV